MTLVLVESALETIPKQLWNHPAVQKNSKQRRKPPSAILLDRSYHHSAMKTLAQAEKRGRPDIVHFAMLEALGSPLNKEKLLQFYVHTLNDYVIRVNPETRLPRNYNRFVSLVEQLFEFGKVPPKSSETPLLALRQQTLTHLMTEIQPSYTLGLSRLGKPATLEASVSRLAAEKKPVVFLGGFPSGHFSEATNKLVNDIVHIDRETLETWTVTSRLIYEFERALSLPEKRL